VSDTGFGIAGGFLDATGASTAPGAGRSPGDDASHVAVAIAAVTDHVHFDQDAIAHTIRAVLSDAAVAGTATGLRQLGSPDPVSEIEQAAQAVQWNEWHAGDIDAFAPLGGPSTVVDVPVVVAEVTESAISRMGHVLAQGLADGHDNATIEASMREIACDVLRSEVIARTETTAALSMAILAVYERHGLDQWDWVAEKDPCPACVEREQGSPYIVGAPILFPVHPNCRCMPTPHSWA